MKIEINLKDLKDNNLSINEYFLLYFLYHKDYEGLKHFFTQIEAVIARNMIIRKGNNFILSDDKVSILDTIISKNNVGKLLREKGDSINFSEFYNEYPIKVGSRVLRTSGTESETFKKYEEKYLKKVKTLQQHSQAIEAVKAFVNARKRVNELKFLPGIDVVLNNSLWEVWKELIEEKGEEGKSWNSEII
jgi:hypothetical protein